MHCPACGGRKTTEIEIRLKDDDAIRFTSCRRCEHRWWLHEEESITLHDVLNLTAKKEPAR